MTSPLYPFKGNANDHAFLKTLQHSQAARVRHHQSQKNERWRVECERIKNQTQDDQPINRALNLQDDTYHQRGWEGTQREEGAEGETEGEGPEEKSEGRERGKEGPKCMMCRFQV